MKNVFLRRGAALLLALALVLGMVPVGVISVPKAAAAGETVVYNFLANAYSDDAAKAETSFAAEGLKTYSGSRKWAYVGHTFSAKFDRDASYGYMWPSAGTVGQWVAFKVAGLSAGAWKVSVQSLSRDRAGPIGAYLLPASMTDSAAIAAEVAKREQSAYWVGEYDFSNSNGTVVKNEVLGAGMVAGAEAVLVLSNSAKGTAVTQAGNYMNYMYIYFKTVTMTKIATLASVDADFSGVYLGQEIKPDIVYYDDKGGVIDAEDSYTIKMTSNADGAVFENAGKYYAASAGSATFEITAEFEGQKKSVTKTAVFTDAKRLSGADASFKFYGNAYSDFAGTALKIAGANNIYQTNKSAPVSEADFANYLYRDYGTERPWGMVAANINRPSTADTYLSSNAIGMDMSVHAGRWAAFKVKIPAAGTYTVDVSEYCYANAGRTEIFMLPYESKMTFADITANINSYIASAQMIADVDFYGSAKAVVEKENVGLFTAEASADYAAKGYKEYLMIVRAQYSRVSTNKDAVLLYSVDLNGAWSVGEGVLGSIEASFENQVGKTLSPTVTWKDILGREMEVTDGAVTFELKENSDGAVLKGRDGNYYAVAAGDATFEVVGTYDGLTKKTNVTVTIEAPPAMSGANASYLFFKGAYPDTADVGATVPGASAEWSANGGVRHITKDEFLSAYPYQDYGTVRPWGMVAAKADNPNSKDVYLGIAAIGLDHASHAGGWIAYKVKVPAPGMYSVDIGGYVYASGGLAKAYMLPYTAEMDYANIEANIDSYVSRAQFIGEADFNGSSKAVEKFVGVGTFVADEGDEYASKGYKEYLMIITSNYSRKNTARWALITHGVYLNGEGITGVETTMTDSVIGVGEKSVIVESVGKNSAGANYDLSDAYIEYTLKEGEGTVASFDADTKTLTAIGEGEAVIETLVIADGVVVRGTTTVTVDNKVGVKRAYLYHDAGDTQGKEVKFSAAVEFNDTTVKPSTDIVKYIIVEESEPGVLYLSESDTKVTAAKLGTAKIKAQIGMRGNVYETDTIEVEIVNAAAAASPNFTISFKAGAYQGDSYGTLQAINSYSPYRNWMHYHTMGVGDIALASDMQFSQFVFAPSAEANYISFMVDFAYSGGYRVDSYAYRRDRAGKYELYLIPKDQVTTSTLASKLVNGNEYYQCEFDFYHTAAGMYLDTFGEIQVPNEGEYVVAFKRVDGGGVDAGAWDPYCMYPAYYEFISEKAVSEALLLPAEGSAHLNIGESIATKLNFKNIYGEDIVYDAADIESTAYTTSNSAVAEVTEDGTVTGVSEGTTEITCLVEYQGKAFEAKLTVLVSDSSDMLGISVSAPESIYIYGSTNLKAIADMASGNKIEIPSEYLTWTLLPESDEGVVEIEGSVATGLAVGTAYLQVTSTFKDAEFTSDSIKLDVTWDTQAEPTIYTIEERENAKKNADKYGWAAAEVASVKASADVYLKNMEVLYKRVVGEGLPRYYHVSHKYDPLKLSCRYCGADVGTLVGSYGWYVDMVNYPWKIQCPGCRRRLPSNDFGSYFELGLDENGNFHPEVAEAKHIEMFGGLENVGFLKNTDFPEKDAELGVSGWGVDNGFGYHQPYIPNGAETHENHPLYVEKDGLAYYKTSATSGTLYPVRHNYIAYYLHQGLWYEGNGSTAGTTGMLRKAINTLAEAFVYTGEAKYGRAGAILLDRVADFFPDYQWHTWADWRGDNYRGKMVDATWSAALTEELAMAYDAFKPIYNDEYVVNFLSKNGVRYDIAQDGSATVANAKDSPGALRKNVEDRLLRQIFTETVRSNIAGNFGMHQASVAAAAVALNTLPETGEMLEWLMKPGAIHNTGANPADNTGGNVMQQLVEEVDRDGHGNEAAPGYNRLWPGNIIRIAELLAGYELYPSADLFKNTKFRKMISAQMYLTLGGYYCVQVGDSGAAGSVGVVMELDAAVPAFKHMKDRELARAIYTKNGDTTDGIRGSILDADPEALAKDIQKIVDEDGPFTIGSDMLTGYGFAALRDGASYKSPQAGNSVTTHRDFAIYFGTGTGHGHSDALNLFMSSFGLNMAPDLGYPEQTGSQPNRMQWIRTTLSHNTVVVDEQEQTENKITGTPHHFDDAGRVKIMDVEADGVYAQTDEYRRTVVMVDAGDDVAYGVDFFHVKGGDDHLYSFHSQSNEIYEVEGLEMEKQVDADGNYIGSYAGPDVAFGEDPTGNAPNNSYPLGYTWLKDVRRDDSPAKDFAVEFKVKDFRGVLPKERDLRLRLTSLNDEALDEVSFSTAIPQKLATSAMIDKLEYLLIRRSGKDLDTVFTTVYEPYEEGAKYIKSIEKVSMVRDESSKPRVGDAFSAVKVTMENGRVDYIMYSNNNQVKYLVDGKIDFRGFAAVYSVEVAQDGSEEVVYTYLNDGDILGESTGNLAAYTGKITDFTRELLSENKITFKPNGDIDTDAIVGKYVYIDNSGVENGAYRIVDAKTLENGDVELDLGDVTLINTYRDSSNMGLGFVYNVSAGDSLRIPMSSVVDNSPVFAEQTKRSIAAGKKLTISFSAESPLDREVVLSAVLMPRGAVFDAESGTFTWTPDSNQIGIHTIGIKATDGSLSSTQYVEVEVFKSSGPVGENSGDTAKPGTPSAPSGGSTSGGTTSGGQPSGSTTPSTPVKPDAPAVDETDGFKDLGGYDWAKDAIENLADKGVVNGTGNNTFSPSKNITRADFALMMVRAFGLESDSTENFADVDANAYYAEALAIGKAHGIINGVGENKYNPTATITRQDMMTVVSRALKALGYELEAADDDTLAAFIDAAEISDYATEHVATMVANGLIKGKTANTIDPKSYTTRAEVAVLIERLMAAFLTEK